MRRFRSAAADRHHSQSAHTKKQGQAEGPEIPPTGLRRFRSGDLRGTAADGCILIHQRISGKPVGFKNRHAVLNRRVQLLRDAIVNADDIERPAFGEQIRRNRNLHLNRRAC